MLTNISRKSTLMTDTGGYQQHRSPAFARHEKVDHGRGEYVRGDAYSNTAEAYFAILKRGIYGVFHREVLERVRFQCLNRIALGVDDTERAARALKGAEGKRLMYSQAIEPRTKKQRIALIKRESRSGSKEAPAWLASGGTFDRLTSG